MDKLNKMAKLDPTATLRQTNRAYIKANRQDWADLGFRSMTALVHDDERAEILAEIEVRKCVALVAMAENPKTEPDLLRILSRRNMTQLPSGGDFVELLELSKGTTAEDDIAKSVDIARNYVKRYRGIEAQYNKVQDDDRKTTMAAKAVAYSAATSAHLKMARVLLEKAPNRDQTIFGARNIVVEDEE